MRRVFVRDGGARVFGTVTTVAVFTSADPCGGGSAAPPSPFPPCADGASPAALQLRDSDLVPTQRGAHSRFWVTWPFFWGGVGGAGVLLLVRFSLRRRTHAYMALPGG